MQKPQLSITGLLHFFSERLFATPAVAGRIGTTLYKEGIPSSLIVFLALIQIVEEIDLN
jgi:hypothetical protein